ncbi:Sieve element occlusion b [Thalictrum thalictroides]|uniref:Sieve element occlusion b n=1 Tax=Thalictrum thalictroides TaxID=46969 RepID=A0A7J6VPI7_THATH|nr:Sieve element occlusion b [Thalictrum thalictroides]
MLEDILATHGPDGQELDVKPLLNLVVDILQNASAYGIEDLSHPASQDQIDAVHKLSSEISRLSLGDVDQHANTLALFRTLSNYSWDAKMVLALAAFGVSYGEFWLMAQFYPLTIMEQNEDALRPRYEALKNLIKVMIGITKCVVEFKELPPQNETHVIVMPNFPTAAYWTIRSVLACSMQIFSLIGLGQQELTGDALELGILQLSVAGIWELATLAHRLDKLHGYLRKQLALCYQHIDAKNPIEAYVSLVETIHIVNIINAPNDMLPLYDGSAKKRVNIEVLRRKNVLLLISDLDINQDDLFALDKVYRDSRHHQPDKPENSYEVVWLPVVNRSIPWSDKKQQQFETIQVMMPWYSVHHQLLLDSAMIDYIKEMWHFVKKPILVVVDPEGRVSHHDALPMVWIWGSEAFPFTNMREEALWKEESWRLELLIDGIDQNILNWIREGRLICLYGGDDITWIRKFTSSVRVVSESIGSPIELVYVGQSNPTMRIRKVLTIINAEKLSYTWPLVESIRLFWLRIEKMWYSKMQHGKTVEYDPIMQEIMIMLSYDGIGQGWAVISKGSAEMAKARGERMLTYFTDIAEWKEQVESKGFIPALNEYMVQSMSALVPVHCHRLILPGTNSTPDMVVCEECGKPMEKSTLHHP